MNRLAIIGNGFDLAHYLHTSYKDFIDWYWKQRLEGLKDESSYRSEDPLCCFHWVQGSHEMVPWKRVLSHCSFDISAGLSGFKEAIDKIGEEYSISKSILLDRITRNIENKGWTDIESDYYELLKANADNIETCSNLNNQMDFLKGKLSEYLATQKATIPQQGVLPPEDSIIDKKDVAQSSKNAILEYMQSRLSTEEGLDIARGQYKVKETMLLNFNYTATAEIYQGQTVKVNYIHGSLDKPEEMIFGYGDEMDKDFKDLENRNENALLKNSKSIKYLETSHYRKLLEFIEGGPFQVYIMGHSCGNSDRTDRKSVV